MENNCNCNDKRMEMAEQLMSILDEDGQPLYSKQWINENILGIIEKETLH
mgnify:CR=1 FL=1